MDERRAQHLQTQLHYDWNAMTVTELSALLARCKPTDKVRVCIVNFGKRPSEDSYEFLEITHCSDIRKMRHRDDVVIDTVRVSTVNNTPS